MKRYWTADWHIFDEEIIDFCKRPHKNIDHAIKRILGDANMRAKKEDILWHVGDFAVKRPALHPRDIIPRVDAKLILVEGNHDDNNGVKADFKYSVVRVGKYRVLVTHYPTFNLFNEVIDKSSWDFLRFNARNLADFAVCGHVHDKWQVAVDDRTSMVNINVGLDVNNYRPVSDQELVAIFEKY